MLQTEKIILKEKYNLLKKYAKIYQKSGLRRGQSLFNALAKIDVSLAKKLCGSEIDCFYNDELCGDFIIEILNEWRKI